MVIHLNSLWINASSKRPSSLFMRQKLKKGSLAARLASMATQSTEPSPGLTTPLIDSFIPSTPEMQSTLMFSSPPAHPSSKSDSPSRPPSALSLGSEDGILCSNSEVAPIPSKHTPRTTVPRPISPFSPSIKHVSSFPEPDPDVGLKDYTRHRRVLLETLNSLHSTGYVTRYYL